MTYSKLIERLDACKEENFASFQRKLIFTDYKILGVRTPTMRKIAKEYEGDISTLFSFPNEYYEVVFIKLAAAAELPYEEYIKYLDQCVALMDNWALCDCFKAKCIEKRKAEFLPVLEKLFQKDGVYYQRFALVTLLYAYVEEKYLPIIAEYIEKADKEPYYIHMAVAWLTAEVLVKAYDFGVALLQKGVLGPKTHNKAIQKAIESYRLNNEQKEFLRSLKIKKVR